MTTPPNAAPRAALLRASRLIQAAAAVVLGLSALLLLAPSMGEAVFYGVYFLQPTSPVALPAEAQAYIRFAHGIIGAVMAGWMFAVIALARGPFLAGHLHAWRAIAWPLAGWFVIDTTFSLVHGVWGNALLNVATASMFAPPLIMSRRHVARA